MGYDKGSLAYLVYYPEANKVERVKCVKFLEQNVCVPKIEDDEILSPTPLTRVRMKTVGKAVLYGDLEDDVNYTVDYCYRVTNIPTTYNHTLKSNEATKWQNAMHDKMTRLNWSRHQRVDK